MKLICEGQNETDTNVMRSDSLFSEYTMGATQECATTLIANNEIRNAHGGNFGNVTRAAAILILQLAREFPTNCDSQYNFNVYDTGVVELGYLMREIKENLPALQEAYDKYYRVPHYATIRIEV